MRTCRICDARLANFKALPNIQRYIALMATRAAAREPGFPMTSLEDLYNAQILELAGNIPLSGRLEAPDATATAHSKLCGSTITIDLEMDGDRVTDFRQSVKACLLGQSSAAIMGRHVIGARASELKDIAARMRRMLKEGAEPPSEAWPEIKLLEPIRAYKARHASTMLVFDAVEDAIRQIEARRSAGDAPAA